MMLKAGLFSQFVSSCCYQSYHIILSVSDILPAFLSELSFDTRVSKFDDVGGIKSPPKELLSPLVVPQKRFLLGPGPSNLSPRVVKALSNPLLGHMHPETFQLMDEIKAGLQYAFQTENRLTLAISASGHSGMEACLANLLEAGDRILIVKGGLWGERAENMSKRLGARVKTLDTELGVAFTLDQLDIIMNQYMPSVVFLTHSESSTGLKQPLIGVGDICRKYEALLIVDTVASLGAEPFFMDAWKIDAAYTGSQKVFGAPPGLTPVSFNSRAEWNIEISGGLGPTVGKIFRIGLMGINANEEVIEKLLEALDEVLTFARTRSQL